MLTDEDANYKIYLRRIRFKLLIKLKIVLNHTQTILHSLLEIPYQLWIMQED